MAKGDARVVLTSNFRLLYPTLSTPRAYQESGKAKGEPRYSTGMIFDADAFESFKEVQDDELVDVDFKKVLMQVARAEWGDDIDDISGAIKHGGIGWPIKKGETYAKKKGKFEDELVGKFLLNAHTGQDYPPALKARLDGKMVNLTRGLTDSDAKIKSLFVGGNYAFAELNVKGTEVGDKKYLTCYLNAVCFVKPGERIGGGGGSIMDRYDGVSGGEADVDPTEADDEAMDDDEIPF